MAVLIIQKAAGMTDIEREHIFKEWLNQYKALIFKTVRSYAFTVMDQDDLFQEIIIQLWHSVPSFRQESSVTTWLYRIALNTAIKWTRKESRHQRAERIEAVQAAVLEPVGQPDDRLEWLYQEIHQLDEVDRSLALLLLEGFSYREMASILGISESNVGVKINRIRKKLIDKSKNGG